jgi:hypothetical protein
MLGSIEEARDAYQSVLLDPLSQGTVDQQLVQWKSLDLPEVQPEPEPVEAAEPAPELAVEDDESVAEEDE